MATQIRKLPGRWRRSEARRRADCRWPPSLCHCELSDDFRLRSLCAAAARGDLVSDPRAHCGSTGHIAARVFPEHYRQGVSLCRVHVHPVLLFHRDDAGCVPAAIVLGPPLGCILVGLLIPVHGRCRNGQVQNVAAELSVAGIWQDRIRMLRLAPRCVRCPWRRCHQPGCRTGCTYTA